MLALQLNKVKNKMDVILEAQREKKKVHFASLMDTSQSAELEPEHKKFQGRVVLRGYTVEDDTGACAVFTEPGSSASQMTAAKAMDVVARLPACAGQAAEPVLACTQVKWRMLQNCS